MTPAQIAEAQKLAREWKSKPERWYSRASRKQCLLWVKSGKAQNEHIMSALPPKADIRSARLNEYTP
jgi:hypothetical protein